MRTRTTLKPSTAAMVALVFAVISTGCSDTTSSAQAVTPAAVATVNSESSSPVAVAAETAADDEPAGVGIPFPPAENLVEWPELVLDDGSVSAAELRAHSLSAGVLRLDQLSEVFGGQWRATWANIATENAIPVPNGDGCDAGTTEQLLKSDGIDLSYLNIDGPALELNLRRGSGTDMFLIATEHFVNCELGPDVFPERTIDLPDEQVAIVHTSNEEVAGSPYYVSSVFVGSGDMLVATSIDASTEPDAEENEEHLLTLVAIILDQLAG